MPDTTEGSVFSIAQELDFIERFYEKYYRLVYRIAWEKCCPDEVEDLAQDVWILLLQKREVLQNLTVSKQISYITVTVENTIRMNRRKKKLDTYPIESIYELGYDGTLILEQIMNRKMQSVSFHKAWQEVNPKDRELLERKYLMEQSDEEIARAVCIKKSHVRVYLHRARNAARLVMQKYRGRL